MSIWDDASSWVGDHITGPVGRNISDTVGGVLGFGSNASTNLANPNRPLSVAPPAGTPQRQAWDAAGGTPPPAAGSTSSNISASFAKWMVAYGALAVIILMMGDSDKYGGVAKALIWVILAGVVFTKWKDISLGFDQTFGTNFTPATA